MRQLAPWLDQLHPSLQNAVRLRIEGERVGLPAPIITPYLVGLLVMLGLLGTFVGMVDTLSGAVFALEGTTELQAIRAGLAAPIQGLSLAFGTSVAGVAASAMLGLISTLSRRDRMLATRGLDSRIATVFKGFSLAYNRQETFKALQVQAQALPDVAQKLDTMADRLAAMGDTLGDTLIASQNQFHQSATRHYGDLATSVDQSLKATLADSARQAGENIKPFVIDAMAAISQQTQTTHQQLTETAQQQLEALTARFSDTSADITLAWQAGLGAHERANEGLITRLSTSLDSFNTRFNSVSDVLLASFEQSSTAWIEAQAAGDQARLKHWTDSLGQAQQLAATQLIDASASFAGELKQVTAIQQASFSNTAAQVEALSTSLTGLWLQAGERMDEFTTTLGAELATLRNEEARRGEAAVERLASLEASVATHVTTLGKSLEDPMTRLIQTASETPRAAAEVIGHLREEISNNIERDNTLLEERKRIMGQLNTLSASLEQTSTAQREAVDQLVSASTNTLQQVGSQFTEQLSAALARMAGVADHFAGSSIEMSSLGEAFGFAVTLFNESNGKLIEQLASIEESMNQSTSRSDEQMGYYVAQAREIIDQTVLSQQEIFEQLHQLNRKEASIPMVAS